MYAPIKGSTQLTAVQPAETPEELLVCTSRLHQEFEGLKAELSTDIDMVDRMIIYPASSARELIKPVQKTIKKRENRKVFDPFFSPLSFPVVRSSDNHQLDFERYQSKANSTTKKNNNRAERDLAALEKSETDLAQARLDYEAADDYLRQHLPVIIQTTLSLLPRILAAQINIQNSLLGTYYTIISEFAEQHGFPSPAPPMADIIGVFEENHFPIQSTAERLAIVHPKAFPRAAATRNQSDSYSGRPTPPPSSPSFDHSGSYRSPSPVRLRVPPASDYEDADEDTYSRSSFAMRTPSVTPPASAPTPADDTKPRISADSATSYSSCSNQSALSSHSKNYLYDFPPPASQLASPISHRPASHSSSLNSSAVRQPHANSSTLANAAAATVAAAAKKKGPPPKPKPKPAAAPVYVTAVYGFDAEEEGELSFAAGEQIRLTRRSEQVNDWWEGELRGVRGLFPGTYVQ